MIKAIVIGLFIAILVIFTYASLVLQSWMDEMEDEESLKEFIKQYEEANGVKNEK